MIEIKITKKNEYGFWETSYEKVTKRELLEYKSRVLKTLKETILDWDNIYKNYNHVVFYSELYDEKGNPIYATVYLDGTNFACGEQAFEELYQRPRQYTIALHRRGAF